MQENCGLSASSISILEMMAKKAREKKIRNCDTPDVKD